MAANDTGSAADSQQSRQVAPSSGETPHSPSSSPSLPPAEQPTAAAQRAGLTQALAELARGERAADKLEAELRVFEAKLEELLASIGVTEEDLDEEVEGEDGAVAEEEKLSGEDDAEGNSKNSGSSSTEDDRQQTGGHSRP